MSESEEGLLIHRLSEPVPEFQMQWVWEAPKTGLPSEFPGAAAGLGTTLGEPALSFHLPVCHSGHRIWV